VAVDALLVAFQKFVSRSAMGIQALFRMAQLSAVPAQTVGHTPPLPKPRSTWCPDARMHLQLKAAKVGQQ